MGVVVRRYIDILTMIINFPYSTCISSFLAAVSLLLCSLKILFSLLVNPRRAWVRKARVGRLSSGELH